MPTHAVTNQAPPLVGHNVFATDQVLVEAVERAGARDGLDALGALAGTAEVQEWATQANANPPGLRTHDRYGNRLDEVDYHPAYHQLMDVAVSQGLHARPWRGAGGSSHLARAAAFDVWSQVEAGHGCPISMTYAIVPALRAAPELAATWEPGFLSFDYDRRCAPPGTKSGLLAGMGMTEKQGGSDVRTNTTRAVPAGEGWELTGHKWFCSAPMSDAWLMLAQAPRGLSCFLVPKWRPDGSRNAVHLQRLKDKLGNRSNASSEVELSDALGWLVGEEGRGIQTIITMVNHTRLDCVIGSVAGMRAALAQALHHTAHRRAFGRELTDQPLMRNVLADLCVESEAATLAMARLAESFDADPLDDQEMAFRRLATPVIKYWVCKRQPPFVAEALECLGGNGYVEESGLPRLYREAPLNGLWEGSGNVICLDVLRSLAREPATWEAVRAEVRDIDPNVDAVVGDIDAALVDPVDIEGSARRIVEQMALALTGALVIRYGAPEVAAAFVASRLAGDWGRAFGTLPPRLELGAVIERHRPRV
ncbi:MAG: acyl-CoA dehydrogenase family protein [Acidimicrobiales bacterium]